MLKQVQHDTLVVNGEKRDAETRDAEPSSA